MASLACTCDVSFWDVIITKGAHQFIIITVFTYEHKINICIWIIIIQRWWKLKASFLCWRASYTWVAATANYPSIWKPCFCQKRKLNCQVNAAILWMTCSLSHRRALLVLNGTGYLFIQDKKSSSGTVWARWALLNQKTWGSNECHMVQLQFSLSSVAMHPFVQATRESQLWF